MRRFVYMCLVLPTLSLGAGEKNQTREEKKGVFLKSLSALQEKTENHSKEFEKGRCYIFDESKKALTLEGVRYKVDSNNELLVDIKLNQKEQKALDTFSKKLPKKSHLVVTVNEQVVNKREHKKGQSLFSVIQPNQREYKG